nr:hypothetical protein GCM10020185_31980 [Pseudomonas brassicacearum subsp. brassicacearum]
MTRACCSTYATIPRNWKISANPLSIKSCSPIFLAEARVKWDIPAIHQQVLASQRRRRFVAQALTLGKLKSWDHQPLVDASQQYMRNHIDLDDLERKARYPQPCQNQ